MKRVVIVDAQLLIGYFDPAVNNDEHQQCGDLYQSMLDDPNVQIALTPLVLYEFLRGIANPSRRELLRQKLEQLTVFNVRAADAAFAAERFRDERSQGLPSDEVPDKHAFDYFHAATAHGRGIALATRDKRLVNVAKRANISLYPDTHA